jgi:broad specificity phosphatase PhoE
MNKGHLHITFLRHGSTETLEAGCIQHSFFGRLSERGQREAELARSALRESSFSQIVVADSDRAKETADIALVGFHDHVPRRYLKWLRERNYGDLVGSSNEEARRQHNESPDPVSFRPNRGESLRDTWERVRGSVRGLLLPEFFDQRILIVGHGTVSKCFLMVLENVFPKDLATYLSWGGGGFDNCSITEILVGWRDGFPKTLEKLRWNDTSHLSDRKEV